jgi:SMC interacting uncharacterized protein involved in chromosome segregation
MDKKPITLDKRLDRIDAHLDKIAKIVSAHDIQFDKMAKAIINGFDSTDKKIDTSEANLKTQIDIYARAVDAYAKQSETYMQEMLALGNKVDRLERQIEQIAQHLNLKLEY